jgi:H+-transporting ATPase
MIDEGVVDVDQAALTGESTQESHNKGDTLYSGSTITRGKATGTVTATGTRSFGRTAELVRTASSASHLEQLLFAVVRYLVTIDAVLAVILAVVALWRGEDLLPLVPFFLVLIIATVPVTMPAAFTVANAVEARRAGESGGTCHRPVSGTGSGNHGCAVYRQNRYTDQKPAVSCRHNGASGRE